MKTTSKTNHVLTRSNINFIRMSIGLGTLIICCTILSGQNLDAAINTAKIVTYPAPVGETSSNNYQVQIEGQTIDTYMARVLDPPFAENYDHGGPYSFANFDMSGPVTIRIKSKRSLQNVVIRPQSYDIKPTLENDHTISFTLERPLKFSVEPDGKKGPLLLFANPPETNVPEPSDKAVIYFGPGLHKPEKIVLESNQTLYIAGGAVVKAEMFLKEIISGFVDEEFWTAQIGSGAKAR
jgi:hypothetical protein